MDFPLSETATVRLNCGLFLKFSAAVFLTVNSPVDGLIAKASIVFPAVMANVFDCPASGSVAEIVPMKAPLERS